MQKRMEGVQMRGLAEIFYGQGGKNLLAYGLSWKVGKMNVIGGLEWHFKFC